jgi:CBS domain-containing protein
LRRGPAEHRSDAGAIINQRRRTMTMLDRTRRSPGLSLHARTAADLMTANPRSISQDASVQEAAAFLTKRGISAAPVIDDAGRPIGVVSRSDILIRFQSGTVGRTPVHEIMTPAVFCVTPDTPAEKVIAKMVGWAVRRLFVVDESGVLIGVISAFNVLKRLRCSEPSDFGPTRNGDGSH